jgi:uncharacterized protein
LPSETAARRGAKLVGSALSRAAARRIAIAAQGLAEPRPTGRVGRRHLHRAFDRMGLIQIDSVNVLARSQEVVLFSRLGDHPRSLLPDAADDGEVLEAWVHVASHIPIDQYPLIRFQMERRLAEPPQWVTDLLRRKPTILDDVLARLADGPVVAGDVSQRVGPKSSWWDWDDGKLALEHLLRCGLATARRRRNDFARIYELAALRLPADLLAAPVIPEREARKEMLRRAARHHGVATFTDLTDYHRQVNAACKPLVAELVEDGELIPVQVDGWAQQAYLHRDARQPRRVAARALLSPFDPLVWSRDRAERLFGFEYRIEIYTPPAKRVYGYYVLPILLGDELVGRVDLKADRSTGRLLVQAAWVEPGVPSEAVAAEVAEELGEMADWLDLPDVVAMDRGDLAPALRAALAAT